MKDLSITQEYLICSLNEKGRLSNHSNEQSICLLIGGLLELQNRGFAQIQNKKVVILKELNSVYSYLQPLYSTIRDIKKPNVIKDIVIEYTMSISGREFAHYFECVGTSLVNEECAEEIMKKGIFNTTKYFVPNKICKENIIQKLRTAILEDGAINAETVILISLLDKSELLKQYFSKDESNQLKLRLNEIKTSTQYELVKEVLIIIDEIFAIFVACCCIK